MNSTCNFGVQASSHTETVDYVLYTIFGIAGMTMNAVAIAAIKMAIYDIRPVHYFLINLSVTDMLICVTKWPRLIVYSYPSFHFDRALNDLIVSVELTLRFMGLMAMLLLGIDQYVAVCHPLRYTAILTKKRIMILIVFSWFLAICIGNIQYPIRVVYMLVYSEGFYDDVPYKESWSAQELGIYICGGLLTISILFVYSRVLIEITKSHRHVGPIPANVGNGSKGRQSNKKAFKTIGLVVGTYLIFHVPIYCLQGLSKNICSNIFRQLSRYFDIWAFLNNIADPLIFSLRMRDVRQGYNKICCNRYKCQRQGDGGDVRLQNTSCSG